MKVCYTITAECVGERILKISQYLAQLWARVGCPLTNGVGALTLLVGQQEGHVGYKKMGAVCWWWWFD